MFMTMSDLALKNLKGLPAQWMYLHVNPLAQTTDLVILKKN